MPLTDPNSHLSFSGGQANGTLLGSASPGIKTPGSVVYSGGLFLSRRQFPDL